MSPQFLPIDKSYRPGGDREDTIHTALDANPDIKEDDIAYVRFGVARAPRKVECSRSLEADQPGEHHLKTKSGRGFYDGRGFRDFPKRYKEQLRQSIDGSAHEAYENELETNGLISAFCQSWLYFGLLSEVLGKFVRWQEFVTWNQEKRPIITLQKFMLSGELEIWRKSIDNLSEIDRIKRISEIESCLIQAQQVTKEECVETFPKAIGAPFLEHVLLSIRTLGIIFDSYLDRFWRQDRKTMESLVDGRAWGIGKLIKDRMLRDKIVLGPSWCRNDFHRLSQRLPATAMYYLSTLSKPAFGLIGDGFSEASEAHNECSEAHCVAENIDEKSYKPAHMPGCDGCLEIGPNTDEIESAIVHGFTPVVRLSKGSSDGTWHVVVSNFRSPGDGPLVEENLAPYVAISHVWAHGMGNVKRNTLPLCRVQYLSKAARDAWNPIQLFPELSQIESDTLDFGKTIHSFSSMGFFWIDTLCVPRTDDLRKLAISRLAQIYKEAVTVLAISADLAGLAPKGPYSTGLSCQRRPAEECAAWVLGTAWMRRLWTLQEALLARTLCIQFYDGPLHIGNLLSGLLDKSRVWTPFEFTSVQLAQSLLDFLVFQTLEGNQGKFLYFWNGMHGRSCSHVGDESICAAQLLSLDVTRILKADSEERTQVLYSMLDTVPQQILFSGNPKIEEISYRWADKDLGRLKFVRDNGSLVKAGQRQKCGLLVQYPGFVFAIDARELLDFQDTIYGYDRIKERWLRFDTRRFPEFHTGMVVPKVIGVILYHEECMELGKTEDNPNGINALLVAFYKRPDLLSGEEHNVTLLMNTSVTVATPESEVPNAFIDQHEDILAISPPSLPVFMFKFDLFSLSPTQKWLIS